MKFGKIAWALAAAFSGMIAAQPPAPSYIPQTRFARGQDVVPSFEGWMKNADGTFTLVFGYLNRNYGEELVIPAGANNKLEPGPADQGQSTFFLPRRHAWEFRVNVPADWGDREMVWTLTANGKTEKAYGSLKSDEEITERIIMTRGNLSPGLDDPNQPPSIVIQPLASATIGQPVTLTAIVSDDGLPKPRVKKTPPAATDGKSQTNNVTRSRIGLTVAWSQYRGPAKAVFEEDGPIDVKSGMVTARVSFLEAGTYVLRATATDGALSVARDIAVIVKGAQP